MDKWAECGNLKRQNAILEIGQHWIQKCFLFHHGRHLIVLLKFSYLKKKYSQKQILFIAKTIVSFTNIRYMFRQIGLPSSEALQNVHKRQE